MNTIIIHPNNRPIYTAKHHLSAVLISPISKWYRKPIPWWVDSVEEVGLLPISETDEFAEEPELDERFFGDEKVEDVGPAGEVDVLKDIMLYINSHDNEFDDVTPTHAERISGSQFIEKIGDDDGEISVLVDEVTFMEIVQEAEREGEIDVFADITLSNEEITLVLEWDETMVSIIVELDSAAGKAMHEEAEMSISVDDVDDKGDDRNELVWDGLDGDMASKPRSF